MREKERKLKLLANTTWNLLPEIDVNGNGSDVCDLQHSRTLGGGSGGSGKDDDNDDIH